MSFFNVLGDILKGAPSDETLRDSHAAANNGNLGDLLGTLLGGSGNSGAGGRGLEETVQSVLNNPEAMRALEGLLGGQGRGTQKNEDLEGAIGQVLGNLGNQSGQIGHTQDTTREKPKMNPLVIGALAGIAGKMLSGYLKNRSMNSQNSRVESYQGGSSEAGYIDEVSQSRDNFLIGAAALGKSLANIDGRISQQEADSINKLMSELGSMGNISQQVRGKISEILNSDIDFNQAVQFVDNISDRNLSILNQMAEQIVVSDGEVSGEESQAMNVWHQYIQRRNAGGQNYPVS